MFAFCAMYLFARVSSTMVLLSANTGATQGSLLDRFDARYVELAGYLLPAAWTALQTRGGSAAVP